MDMDLSSHPILSKDLLRHMMEKKEMKRLGSSPQLASRLYVLEQKVDTIISLLEKNINQKGTWHSSVSLNI